MDIIWWSDHPTYYISTYFFWSFGLPVYLVKFKQKRTCISPWVSNIVCVQIGFEPCIYFMVYDKGGSNTYQLIALINFKQLYVERGKRAEPLGLYYLPSALIFFVSANASSWPLAPPGAAERAVPCYAFVSLCVLYNASRDFPCFHRQKTKAL